MSSQRQRHEAIMRIAFEDSDYLPCDSLDRHDCKVLVKRGLLEPRQPLGYKPTSKALRKRT